MIDFCRKACKYVYSSINYKKNRGLMKLVNIKKYVKYIIFGGFIGLLLIYLQFKRVNIKK